MYIHIYPEKVNIEEFDLDSSLMRLRQGESEQDKLASLLSVHEIGNLSSAILIICRKDSSSIQSFINLLTYVYN